MVDLNIKHVVAESFTGDYDEDNVDKETGVDYNTKKQIEMSILEMLETLEDLWESWNYKFYFCEDFWDSNKCMFGECLIEIEDLTLPTLSCPRVIINEDKGLCQKEFDITTEGGCNDFIEFFIALEVFICKAEEKVNHLIGKRRAKLC